MAPWYAPTTARWTVGDDLTYCQLYLRDEGELISRAELLDYYREGYRQLCAFAQAARQWRVLDLPPRATVTYTYAWEQRSTFGGTSRQIGYRGPNGSTYTYAWELEQSIGVTPTDGAAVCCTQLWEYAYLPDSGTTDQYYSLALDRSHERIAQVYWDNKFIPASSVRELDAHSTAWWREQGEPQAWARSTTRPRQFDVYQFVTTYQQGYQLVEGFTATAPQPSVGLGIVRELSGSRTYAWASDDSTAPYGIIRSIASGERDYVAQPTWQPALGTIRDWGSSDDNLMIWETVVPDEPALVEADTPWLVPAQLQKYLRAYVLAQAFMRQGELENAAAAAWFLYWWERGKLLMRHLGWVTRRDRGYQRNGPAQTRRAVPRPRLPSTFPRYLGV